MSTPTEYPAMLTRAVTITFDGEALRQACHAARLTVAGSDDEREAMACGPPQIWRTGCRPWSMWPSPKRVTHDELKGTPAMTEHDTPNTMSRVQRQIDMISNAETEELSRICKHICSGYLLALLFEGLIDNREHAELDAASCRARSQWLLPAERESAE